MTSNVDPPGYAPPPQVHIRLYISDTVQIPTPSPYIIVSYDKTHTLTANVDPQRVSPTPTQKQFRSVQRIKGLKMRLSCDDELKLKLYNR